MVGRPEAVDFKPFVGLPRLIKSIVTEVDAIPSVVSDALAEVQRRYTYFERLSVTDLGEYRQLRAERLESARPRSKTFRNCCSSSTSWGTR